MSSEKIQNQVTIIPMMEVQSNETIKRSAIIREGLKGTFKFNKFAMAQFLHGFKLQSFNKTTINPNHYKLLSTLAVLAIELNSDNPTTNVEFNREDVLILREMLQSKIDHCTKEREENSERFNRETFLNMKELMLDIRAWLEVAIVEYI